MRDLGIGADMVGRIQRVARDIIRPRRRPDGVGRGRLITRLNGRIVSVDDNIWTSAGIAATAARLAGGTTAPITHMAIGTGSVSSTAAPAAGDTALGNQVAIAAIANASLTSSGGVVTAVHTFGAGAGTGTITEMGIFSAASGGTLFARAAIANPPNKQSGDSLQLTWTFTLSAS